MSLSNYKSLITVEIQGHKKIDMNRKEKKKPQKSFVFRGFERVFLFAFLVFPLWCFV